ncbi:hypothetical protein [Prescottella agglutinans]|uniref:Uncharacterized protein n=1 Tax=Prescottella agglutinans TaxID=1644129 RepID=A0ABT6MIC8_9NOCA|nr:hypothetical protein [Prescottella agglutinans]MDH6283990.1 hypothetical protein [Prescottella agglutinans]
MLTIQRRITIVDTEDTLTAEDFTGPEGGDRVVDLLLEHPTALVATAPDVTVVVAGRRLLQEDGTGLCELAASVHKIEPGGVRCLDLIVCDLEDGLPGLTSTGAALLNEALDAVADLVNAAFDDASGLLTIGAA